MPRKSKAQIAKEDAIAKAKAEKAKEAERQRNTITGRLNSICDSLYSLADDVSGLGSESLQNLQKEADYLASDIENVRDEILSIKAEFV